jgi:PGF-CTERM protein
MKNTIKAALAVLVIMCFIGVILPATAIQTIWNGGHYPDAMDGKTGSVTGRVTTSVNGTVGIGQAYIAIVNASNVSEEYYNTTSDAYGNYQITGVNATYSSVQLTGSPWFGGDYNRGTTAYMIYANKSPYGEGWSAAFGINENQSGATTTSVVIFTKPARIELKAERSHVMADSIDNIKITGYMYDALGNPVADGYMINFTVGNATNNTWMEYGFPWTDANGSLNSFGTESITNVPTKDNTGSASVQFGWVNEAYGGNNATIWAYYADDSTVFASIKIYFEAPTASWTGYVVDSFGTGYGGINVKLHVMSLYGNGTAYEMYNMTRTTSSSQPFVGLFAFDYIVMNSEGQNASYGYVDAQAQLTDNLTIYGKSNNYTMNRSATSIGSIVLKIPPPDALKLTAEKNTILVGGENDWIVAQLYLNGLPYKRANIAVTFDVNNTTVANLPKVKTNITDLNGQAWILLISNDTVGKVLVNGTAAIMYNHNLTDEVIVRVVGWGTVSGIVTDQNRVGIPNANVTLWNVKWNETSGKWENTEWAAGVIENPQLSNDGRTAAVGMYTYYRVPWNIYNVTGEKEGHSWYALFVLGPRPTDIKDYKNASFWPGEEYGTATHNIAIPDYSYIPPASVTPTPVSVTPTTSVAPSTAVSVKPTPGFETLFALAGLLGVAYLIARKEN